MQTRRCYFAHTLLFVLVFWTTRTVKQTLSLSLVSFRAHWAFRLRSLSLGSCRSFCSSLQRTRKTKPSIHESNLKTTAHLKMLLQITVPKSSCLLLLCSVCPTQLCSKNNYSCVKLKYSAEYNVIKDRFQWFYIGPATVWKKNYLHHFSSSPLYAVTWCNCGWIESTSFVSKKSL